MKLELSVNPNLGIAVNEALVDANMREIETIELIIAIYLCYTSRDFLANLYSSVNQTAKQSCPPKIIFSEKSAAYPLLDLSV